MLVLLIAFFALFGSLVRFAEHVIRPRREATLPPAAAPSEAQDQGTLP
jgi:hypothetical protein